MAAYGYEATPDAERRKRVGLIKEALQGVEYSLNHNLKTLDHHRKRVARARKVALTLRFMRRTPWLIPAFLICAVALRAEEPTPAPS